MVEVERRICEKKERKSAGKGKLQDREKKGSEKEGKEGRLTGNISGERGTDEEM